MIYKQIILVQNRIVVHDNGTMSAAWTMSSELNSSWSDRGTGYNYFDGTVGNRQ